MRGFQITACSSMAKERRRRPDWQHLFVRVFWDGGSTFDAWLNISSSKIAEGLLTIPYSCAQMGLASGIGYQLLLVAMGWWSCCMINMLYLRYRSIREQEDPNSFDGHTIQFYEVLGGLLGPWWKGVALFFNIASLFTFAAVQILACSNIVYYMNGTLHKRTWTLIFGGCFSLSILIPTAQNYRVWSFVGVIATAYTAWYLAIAALVHGKDPTVRHSAPRGYTEYFTGATNLINLGGEFVPVEIMDAMWKPKEFKVAYLYGVLYVLSISLPSSTSVYLMFGDEALTHPNALSLLPSSKFRDAAIILMLLHQFIMFGIFTLPIYLTWEKLFRVHNSGSYMTRTLVRIPVFLALWFTALAFPFFGLINSVYGSIFVSWGAYIIPCAAYIATFWTPASRSSATKRPFSALNWATIFSINLGIIIWLLVVGCGLGSWASISTFSKQAHKFGLFLKCYECKDD